MRLGVGELVRHPLFKKRAKKIEKFVRPIDTESTEQTTKSEVPNNSEPWTSIDLKKKPVLINSKNP